MIKLLKRIIKFLRSRIFIIISVLLLQIVFSIYSILYIQTSGFPILLFSDCLAVLFTFVILNRDFNPAYKLTWIITIFIIPVAGVILYILFGKVKTSKKLINTINNIIVKDSDEFSQNNNKIDDIENPEFINIARYIRNTTGRSVFENTSISLLTPGENQYKVMLDELKKAKKFILLEYFIINDGVMWNGILDILRNKVQEGVEVKLLYDDFGCITKLPSNFKKQIKKYGIDVINFNPITPKFSNFINYRDHRKIMVIDGETGFTGGCNISDEYINQLNLFGHWKDDGIVIKGEGVWSLTVMFLQMWEISTSKPIEYSNYKNNISVPSKGYVQIFGDSAISPFQTIAGVYIKIINKAKKYVYITTPYLILDNETLMALKNSALSGVDVRIITPHVPDKKAVFYVTQSYYKELINCGVKIYEYIPGFLHSKMIVSDDDIAMIGTANLDFRSLYLHFEVSCLMYDMDCVNEIHDDVISIIEKSKMINSEDIQKISIFKKLIAFLLRAFSPLL